MDAIPRITFNPKSPKVNNFEIINMEIFDSLPKQQIHDSTLPHKVDFYVMLFFTEDIIGKHWIDFKAYKVKKGSLLFIAKEQIHAFDKHLIKKGFMLFFTLDFLEKSLLNNQIQAHDRLFNFHLYEPLIQTSNQQFDRVKAIFEELNFEFSCPDSKPKEEILYALFQVLILRADKYKTINTDKLHTKYYRDFTKFQMLLHQYASYYRNVQFYADELNMTIKKLNHITKSVANQSTKDYINNYIILLIKRSLINSDMNIKELSFHFHFDEPTNFVKFFKKYVGETPHSFQRNQFHQQ